MLQSGELLREVQQLKESILELHAEQQTKLQALETSHREILYVMKRMSADDREKRLILNLKRSIEIDYDLHVKGNLAAWTAEYCKSCRSIRALMYEYEGEHNPILSSEGEERRLLRHLNKITRRADRTEEEDEMIRRGYYKVLHRVLNSLTTMDYRDEMDRVDLKRVVQYISTRLVEYWNCGVPVIKSYHRDGDIRLISSQAVFQDIWTSIRSHRYYKEKREANLVDGEVNASSAQPNVKSETNKSIYKPVRRVGLAKRSYPRSGASPASVSTSSTPSSQSSYSPSNHSFSTTASEQAAYMSMERNFPDREHPLRTVPRRSPHNRGFTMSTARRYVTRSAASSASNSPYANSPGSYFSTSPRASGKTLARRLDTSLVNAEDSETESDSVPSDQEESEEEEEENDEEEEEEEEQTNEKGDSEGENEVEADAAVGSEQDEGDDYENNGSSMELDDVPEPQSKVSEKSHNEAEADGPMTPHQVRWDWETRDAASINSRASRDSRDSAAEEEAEAKMNAIFKKHLGEQTKKLRRGDLECITTPLSVAGRMAYSGSSQSGGWGPEDGNIAVESDAEHEKEKKSSAKDKVNKSGVAVVASDSEIEKSDGEGETLFDPSIASVVLEVVKEVVKNSPATAPATSSVNVSLDSVSSIHGDSPHSLGSASTPSRSTHLRWSMPLSNETTPSSSKMQAATTPNCTIASGAAIAIPSPIEESSTSPVDSPSTDSGKKRHKSKHEHKREHKRSKKSHEGILQDVAVAQSVDSAASEKATTSAIMTSFASPRFEHTTDSARSPMSAAFQSPNMGGSPDSSVCTNATTPSNGLFYLDLQDEKLLKKQRRKERREKKRAARESGSSSEQKEKKRRHKHRDSMSVSSADTANTAVNTSSKTGTHDCSALTAILGSVSSPLPASC